MKYTVFSQYITPLVCNTAEEAQSALYLLECVGGFGWIAEMPEDIDSEPVVCDIDVSTHVKSELEPVTPPKPRGRPRSTK